VRYWLLLSLFLCQLSLAFPTFQEVKSDWRSSDVIFLDRNFHEMQRIRVDKKARRMNWVGLNDISPAFRHALVMSEDKRFYEHSGVDWSAVAAASWSNLWNQRTRGASTITMQLAGLIDAELHHNNQRRSVWQKIGQAFSAKDLETNWTKAQILEAYMNMVSFRGELVGIGALSAVMFGKAPSGLDATEAAIAVALIRAPNAPSVQVAQRACQILRDMKQEKACQSAMGETVLAFARRGTDYSESLAPHYGRKILAMYPGTTAGTRVRTTLDANLQRYATETLRRYITDLADRNVEDGALIVLDNASGDILAWVGSTGTLSRAREVDGVTALRQAGSTLKPFLFQLAIDGKWLTAASLLDDSPINLQTSTGLYNPQNYSHDYKGLVSVRTSLGSSLNIPSVRTIEIVTPTRFKDRLNDLGLTSLTGSGDFYGYSLALGGADIRLQDLTNAYRTLANQGMTSPLHWIVNTPKPATKRVVSAESSFIISDILSDRAARTRTFGLENALGTRFWSAVKTGTSKDMRDNWAIGYSRHYTVGVWVGNASGEPMWGVSGMHGAAPVWLNIMNYLQENGKKSAAPVKPAGVVRQRVTYENQQEASRIEYFLAGTEQSKVYLGIAVPRILSPVDKAVYAIDPDIPPRNQKIVFRASGVKKAVWWLSGKKVGEGSVFGWAPWPGRYRLELRDEAGKVVQGVQFEVRGVYMKDARVR
jgi:penicillin-binding protein 1C